MTRKSKQSGGNFPLTHYERTKKFKSSEYGTTSKRLAGHSQYQIGDCALSLTSLKGDSTLCSPSGYLYSQEAIIDYLVTKTGEIKEQQAAFEQQELKDTLGEKDAIDKEKREKFSRAQKVVQRSESVDRHQAARDSLKRSSYWLADSQPGTVEERIEKPPERPLSPHSQEPLKRKDLWPVEMKWDAEKLICQISDKAVSMQPATAYWTDKKKPGHIVLTKIYDDLIKDTMTCPSSNKRVKYTRQLQQSGSSFSASGQQVQVKKYRPTIT